MNPVPQLRTPLTTVPSLSLMTTKPGRFLFSVPKPYDPHAPTDGRPPNTEPVFIMQTPPAWLMPSETQERMTARSSACSATFSNQLEIQRPLSPRCSHFRLHSRSGDFVSPIAVIGGLKLAGSGW